ncbi:MAG: threonine/serine dehydratase [Alphaproteobacteria bacterium]|jgi:threonine dehydratase|nr:threonine/serine dehydratase [Beijerinckiaceae bacterium]NBQ38890.1 threonine/serine dehydratase [Alphaproteobacteria bacterium]
MALPITRDAITEAYHRIAPHIRHTPLLPLNANAFGLDAAILFKLEFLQHAGSFKSRGAFNGLLSSPLPKAGVTAASGGNHGAAVAFAARQLGVKAKIFVPEISSPIKIETIRSFGAEVVVGGARYDDAQAACNTYAEESGSLLIHPFDAPTTLAGQGTIALEWEADDALPDTVIIACGGGGLIGGIAAWWHNKVKIVGVEPEGSRCLHAALEAGGPVPVEVNSVAGDSLGAKRVGQMAFDIARAAVDHVALVSDDAIREAQKILWSDFRIMSEPGGAAALAALLSGAYKPQRGERVGVLLCGANVDPTTVIKI